MALSGRPQRSAGYVPALSGSAGRLARSQQAAQLILNKPPSWFSIAPAYCDATRPAAPPLLRRNKARLLILDKPVPTWFNENVSLCYA